MHDHPNLSDGGGWRDGCAGEPSGTRQPTEGGPEVVSEAKQRGGAASVIPTRRDSLQRMVELSRCAAG